MIKFIIGRPILVSMIIIGLCILGVVSYNQLPVELIPFAELPMLIVQVGTTQDADPNHIERQGIIPLESVIASLEDIESIESFIDRRRATIFVYYVSGTDLKYAYLKLQAAVNGARERKLCLIEFKRTRLKSNFSVRNIPLYIAAQRISLHSIRGMLR